VTENEKNEDNPDWQAIHDELGCVTCRFVDLAWLYKGECCTLPDDRRPQKKTGRCGYYQPEDHY